VFAIGASGTAFAAGGKMGRSADGLSCSFSVPANASPAARCAPPAVRRKIRANYCGDKMLSAREVEDSLRAAHRDDGEIEIKKQQAAHCGRPLPATIRRQSDNLQTFNYFNSLDFNGRGSKVPCEKSRENPGVSAPGGSLETNDFAFFCRSIRSNSH
jgi:hypothetical protein